MYSMEDEEIVRNVARRFASQYPYPDFDDLVQEGLLRVDRARASYDPERAGPFRAYLILCLNNLYLDVVRKELRRLRRLRPAENEKCGDFPCPRAINPIRAMLRREWLTRLVRAVLRLPPAERTVVELMLQDADDAEIVRATGSTPSAIQTARCRALPRLRDLLAGDLLPA